MRQIAIPNINKWVKKEGIPEVFSTTVSHTDPGTLFSYDIFGYSDDERYTKLAYIDLKGHYINPVIYRRVFQRHFSIIVDVVSGKKYVKLTKQGTLVECEPDEGGTGLEWLYKNYNNINFDKMAKDANKATEAKTGILKSMELVFGKDAEVSIANLVKKSLNKFTREQVFQTKFLVLPLAMRDVNTDTKHIKMNEINEVYISILSMVKFTQNKRFTADVNVTKAAIQRKLCETKDLLDNSVYKKKGIQNDKVYSRSIDNVTRLVISAPFFDKQDSFKKNYVNDTRMGLPLGAVCAGLTPFIVHGFKAYLYNLADSGFMVKRDKTNASKDDIDAYYTPDRIKAYIKHFGKMGTSFKLTKLFVPSVNEKYGAELKNYIMLNVDGVLRPATLTDILYMVAVDKAYGKHAQVTRYPITDRFNCTFGEIFVMSTIDTSAKVVNGIKYDYYPQIPEDLKPGNENFIETLHISNLWLTGLNADYDGDQVKVVILWADDSNAEIAKKLTQPSNVLDVNGQSIKTMGMTPIQSAYSLTRNPRKGEVVKVVDDKTTKTILEMGDDIKPSYVIKLLGGMNKGMKYKETDTFIFKLNGKKKITTTLGRYLFNTVVFSDDYLKDEFFNYPFDKKKVNAKFDELGYKILEGHITTTEYSAMLSRFEKITFRLAPLINPSLSYDMYMLPPAIKAKRAELIKKNKAEIEKGNLKVVDGIVKTLIELLKKHYEGTVAADLFDSKAKPNYENTMKETILMMGAVPQADGKIHISTSNWLDGIKTTEIAPISNTAVVGATARGNMTAVGGYITKQINALAAGLRSGPRGSDCGTKRYYEATFDNEKDIMYRFVKEGNKDVRIDSENIHKYLNKKIKLRSIMYCENKNPCNKCIGDMHYLRNDTDKSMAIGLDLFKSGTEITQKYMKLVHDITLKTTEIKNIEQYVVPLELKEYKK